MPARLRIARLQSALAGPYTLQLERGECLVIQGPSGAGKSVLLRMICDLDPNHGTAMLDGVERASMSAPAWRAQVAYQPAEPAWWAPTVAAHFKHYDGARLARAHALLTPLQLAPALLERELTLLSTGERQRLALVRTLASQPPVLLLDEPTAALDPQAAAAVEAVLARELARGAAMILVTHSETQARRLAGRRLLMRDHRLLEQEPAP